MVDVGQQVKIVAGAFGGNEATVVAVDAPRIRVKLELFGSPMEVDVTFSDLGMKHVPEVAPMGELLAEFDALYSDAAPRRYERLRPGLGGEAIAAHASRLGAPVPAEMHALYSWKDGTASTPDGWSNEFVDGEWFEQMPFDDINRFVSLESACGLTEMWRGIAAQRAGNGERCHWREGFIPLLETGSHGLAVVDTTGYGTGVEGQVLWFDYKTNEDYQVVAESVRHWLAGLLAMLREGKLFVGAHLDRVRLLEKVHGPFLMRVGPTVPYE